MSANLRSADCSPTAVIGRPGRHRARGAAARRRRAGARTPFARLNLPRSLRKLPPASFSGGEPQRVNIGRGFVEPERLPLLDEATASPDAANRRVAIALGLDPA